MKSAARAASLSLHCARLAALRSRRSSCRCHDHSDSRPIELRRVQRGLTRCFRTKTRDSGLTNAPRACRTGEADTATRTSPLSGGGAAAAAHGGTCSFPPPPHEETTFPVSPGGRARARCASAAQAANRGAAAASAVSRQCCFR